MLAIAYVGLVAVLAYHLQNRVRLLDGFAGVFRYLFSLGLTLFLVNWLNFLLYVALGWGRPYLAASWAGLLAAVVYLVVAQSRGPAAPPGPPLHVRAAGFLTSRWDIPCLVVFGMVLIRFYVGLDSDEENSLWSTFNFDDTAFHLSVTNALLNAGRFPPMDLDMAPYPLKYHFLVDFWLAHLRRLDAPLVVAVHAMNCLSATIMVGALWAALKRWLGLSSRWTMLACLIFLFFNTALINVIHYLWFRPPYFRPGEPIEGLLLYPYFNFESSLLDMFSPQRGLLFTFPVALLVLDAIFGRPAGPAPEAGAAAARTRTLEALVLVCLLPFSHIVTFAVLALMVVPRLWEHRRWLAPRFAVWLPATVLLALQLLYLAAYGPSPHPDYAAWGAASALPLEEFASVPWVFRRALFWFFIDGDFLFWGGLFAAGALLRRERASPLGEFLRRWGWYFAVCGFFFLVVNYYRYSFEWGDSNKFILFLNLGLTMVIVLGAAGLRGRVGLAFSRGLRIFLLVLCVAPPAYRLVASVLAEPYGSVMLFHGNERAAARWLRTSTRPTDIVLTGAYGTFHFVSALAGRPVLAGIYGDSNPYHQEGRAEEIRRVYEEADLAALRRLNPQYLCISRFERDRYRLHPVWEQLARRPGVTVFHAGAPGDFGAIDLLDARAVLRGAADPRETSP